MRLTVFLMIVATLKVSAGGYAQSVSVSLKNAPLEEVFSAVKKQTGYVFFYEREVLRSTKRVTIEADNLSLNTFLTEVFALQPLEYSIKDKTIFIKRKPLVAEILQAIQEITGTVRGEDGEALIGVTVKIKGTNTGAVTDANGQFRINAEQGQVLVISYIGHETQEVTVSGSTLSVVLKPTVSALDETVIIGYGTTIRRNSTSSISSVTSKDMESQPVMDPLAALQGRVPGLVVTSTSGMPGASFQVRLRGQNSLRPEANDPLYVIDGVPFFSEPLNQFNSANGTQSPLASINPSDIERIDILKDADATAIYGSRAANGVILITTKKGNPGKTQFNFGVNSGGSKVANMVDMLNTQEYLKMREEAFEHDNIVPDPENAADLVTWDRNAHTDWQKYMIGNTGKQSLVTGSVSGGNAQTRFLLSGTFNTQTSVLPDADPFSRGAGHLNVDHSSLDGRFNISTSINYSGTKDRSIASDLTAFYDMAPNYPLYDADGKYYWHSTEQNPAAYLLRRSTTRTNNLVANSAVRYTVLPDLNVKVNLGYNTTTMDQVQVYPDATFNPISSVGNMSYFGNSSVQSYIIEPQADYTRTIGKGSLQLLAGATWQENVRKGSGFTAYDFSSDELLEDISAAATLQVRPTTNILYRYTSVFGRATYNWDSKYILNASFRRDGSTRFGPGKRFGNFGAVGAAWVFSEESFLSTPSFLSFGKLRGSYGLTGNDQIGDYAYLDSWSSNSYPYDGSAGLSPSRIPNGDYRWEENRKMELAIELGFLKDRILFNTNFYRNISGNQLVNFALSPQTGFGGVVANFPAEVLNTGWEFDVTSVNIDKKDFRWNTSFNISFAKNELKQYPDFENSSYKETYQVGQSLSIVRGYQFAGIDPATGEATFADLDESGTIDEFVDYVVLGKTMPDFYGGLSNTFTYKNIFLDFLFQFTKQEGPQLNYGYSSVYYGALANKDISALDRWQAAGDVTHIPRASRSAAATKYDLYRLSSGVWGDASFIRLKNISLGYDLSGFTKGWKLSRARIYASAQNLFTITSYDGFDPETQGLRMPPMKTITAGLQIGF
ncbi:TonB-dependent receptor [Chitinophaga sp. XS-30]|uniref:TonB-dependent receptor n=1 Tax=Chitinophaga sp. XS-30 TaxID=2604421 RepID=UPI00143DDDBD|nr:TonB-dependent receptor [Chitinophaga sp. XS-30]